MFVEQRLAGLAGLARDAGGAALRRFQSRQLRALVRHAHARVPFYRRHFDRAGLKPEHVRGIEDLARIPPVSRADLQQCDPAELIAHGVDPRRLVEHRTSGSTGAPLTIRRTAYEDRLLQAYRLKLLFRLGLRWWHKRVSIEDQPAPVRPLHVRLGLLRYEGIDCLLPRETIIEQLRALRPDVLRGYAGTLGWLAETPCSELRALAPRFVTTDSEMLTSGMRACIEQAFGAPVIDFYDSHEFNVIAWQPPGRRDYEVSSRSILAEVLRDGEPVPPGFPGELVGTALHSWAMPFIRYRLGDQVARGEAPESLASIHGRVADRFLLPGGRTIHPYLFADVLVGDAPWLLQYQVVQQLDGRIEVKVAALAGERPSASTLEALRARLHEAIDAAVPLEIELVERIAPGTNGKTRPYYRADAGMSS